MQIITIAEKCCKLNYVNYPVYYISGTMLSMYLENPREDYFFL